MNKSIRIQEQTARFNELVEVVRQKYMEEHGTDHVTDSIIADIAGLTAPRFSQMKRADKALLVERKFEKAVKNLCQYAGNVSQDYVLYGRGKLMKNVMDKEDVLVIDADDMMDLSSLDDALKDLPEITEEQLQEGFVIVDDADAVPLDEAVEPAPEVEEPMVSDVAPSDDAPAPATSDSTLAEPSSDVPLSAEDKWLNAIVAIQGEIDNSTNTAAVMHDGILHIFMPAEDKQPWRCEKFKLANMHKPFETIVYDDDIKEYDMSINVSCNFKWTVKASSTDEAQTQLDNILKNHPVQLKAYAGDKELFGDAVPTNDIVFKVISVKRV